MLADILLRRRPRAGAAALSLANHGAVPRTFVVGLDSAYPGAARTRRHVVAPGASLDDVWSLAASDLWYDLSIRIEGEPSFLRRFAGRIDDGRPGRTDPAIGAMRLET